MQKQFILVAYLDLIGSTRWSKKIVRLDEYVWPPQARVEFMKSYYEALARFAEFTRFSVKYVGDGALIINEIDKKDERAVLGFLFWVNKLNQRIIEIIKKSKLPPDGIRARVTAGISDKIYNEYTSIIIDLAANLLHVEPLIPFICHGSIVSLVGKDNNDVTFKKLPPVKFDASRIDFEDANDLWEPTFN